MPRGKIRSGAARAVKNLVQLLDCVNQQIALFFADCGKVSANSISQHDFLLRAPLVQIKRRTTDGLSWVLLTLLQPIVQNCGDEVVVKAREKSFQTKCALAHLERLGMLACRQNKGWAKIAIRRSNRLAVSVGPADVYLEARGSRHQNEFFARRHLDRIGDRWFLHGGILAGVAFRSSLTIQLARFQMGPPKPSQIGVGFRDWASIGLRLLTPLPPLALCQHNSTQGKAPAKMWFPQGGLVVSGN
jgi:hypothetical protein